MRHFSYKFLATILIMASIASANAQTLSAVVSWDGSVDYTPVSIGNTWHIVDGTLITVTLEATTPTNTQERVYEETISYKKDGTNLSGNIDKFTPTNGDVNYTALYKYKIYTLNTETLEWETDNILHDEESEPKVITFKTYAAPSITINSLSPSATSTYDGGPNVTVSLSCTTNAASVDGYTERIEWKEGASGNYSEGTNSYVFNPADKSNTTIYCKVSIIGPDGNVWGTPQEESVSINVLPAPSITINSLTSSAASTYDRGPNVTVSLSCTTNAASVDGYTERIEWKEGASGNYSEGTNTYDFSPAGKSSTTIYCKVSIIGPDGNVWGTPQEESVNINVLPAPSITINSLTPSAASTYDGGPNVTVSLSCTTNAASVDGYTERIEWREGTSGNYSEGTNTYDFNPDGKSSTTIYCKVSIIGPDGNVWGEYKERNITLNVYSVPEYIAKGIHKNKTDDTTHEFEYSTYKNVVFDASRLFSCQGGNPDGWQYELYVAGEKMPGLTFTPNNAGDYIMRLVVKNVSPSTSELWYKNSDDGNGIEYTLHVYDKPIWTTNIAELFADVSDTGIYNDVNDLVLHVKSGDTVPFKINVQGGDISKTDAKMAIGDEEDAFSSFDSNNYTYNFRQTNDSDVEKVFSFSIHISNNIDYLIEGQEIYSKNISGKIVVWKDITANVADLSTDTDGNYLLEICEEDNGKQEIKINLIGGNPEKWLITPDNGNIPVGSGSKNGSEYTYTINNANLKANNENAKTYKYSFTIQYLDGQTRTSSLTKDIYIKVWPKPEINPSLAMIKNEATITYNGNSIPSQKKIIYTVNCYDGDEFVLNATPSGGNIEAIDESWEYVMTGSSVRKELPTDKNITITQDKSGLIIIKFFNALKTDEVISVETNIIRNPIPDIDLVLPNVDNTSNKDWTDAEEVDGSFLAPVHLYGDGTQTASFVFSPKSGNEGYIEGWTYSCNRGSIVQSTATAAQWEYNIQSNTTSSYEDQIISINIKNSIPASDNQSGENIGLQKTKIYHLRVWHEVILPSDYSLTDNNNPNNYIKSTHAIREGNTLKGHVNPIEFGYNPGASGSYYEYFWEGQGTLNQNDWQKDNITNSVGGNSLGRSLETYKLTVRNKGPRGTIWAVKTFSNCDVYIYNRPETPTKLIKKGNGTSGTMIIEYNGISDDALLASGDYVIDFYYTDASGDHKIIAKPQTETGDIRWATGYSNASQMDSAYVYAHWLDAESGVLITSGKRTLNSVDENWDGSMYNLSPDQISGIRALTRAGDGNYTAIHAILPDEIDYSVFSVYNINGMKVGNTTKGLSSGIYIIRYLQDGEVKTKKLSVK